MNITLHHEVGPVPCPLCESKKETAHPLIGEWFDKIKAQFPDMHCAWMFRDEENQNRAYLEGLTRARWPHSPHNHMRDGKPHARAMDLFRLRPDKIAEFRREWFAQIAAYLDKVNAPLFWGGIWQMVDGDHYQLNNSVPDGKDDKAPGS